MNGLSGLGDLLDGDCCGFPPVVKKQTTLLPTRGRTHWRRDDDFTNDTTLLLEEGKGTTFAQSFLRDPAGIERWESKVVRCEKLNGKLDDEIKRAGLESLLPEELEKHLFSTPLVWRLSRI